MILELLAHRSTMANAYRFLLHVMTPARASLEKEGQEMADPQLHVPGIWPLVLDSLNWLFTVVAAGLGGWAAWKQIQRDRVHLCISVEPISRLREGELSWPIPQIKSPSVKPRDVDLCIHVVNESAFPVQITEIGFTMGIWKRRYVKFAALARTGESLELPHKLESRGEEDSDVRMIAHSNYLKDMRFHQARKVYVRLHTGKYFRGRRKDLAKFVEVAIRCQQH